MTGSRFWEWSNWSLLSLDAFLLPHYAVLCGLVLYSNRSKTSVALDRPSGRTWQTRIQHNGIPLGHKRHSELNETKNYTCVSWTTVPIFANEVSTAVLLLKYRLPYVVYRIVWCLYFTQRFLRLCAEQCWFELLWPSTFDIRPLNPPRLAHYEAWRPRCNTRCRGLATSMRLSGAREREPPSETDSFHRHLLRTEYLYLILC